MPLLRVGTQLRSTVNLPDDETNVMLIEDALHRLSSLGLLETEGGALRMHRLLAAFVRRVVADEEAQAAVEAALVNSVSPLIDERYPTALLLDLLPHLRAVTDAAKVREDEQAGRLCNQLGECLRMVGFYQEARPYLERALAITEKVLGAEHPDTATSLNNLALLLKNQGNYDEAKPLYERALAIYEKALGVEHPNTKLIQENLANLNFRQQGFFHRLLGRRTR